jgi:hypothetical protein
MTIRKRDRQPCAAMPAIARHHQHPLTSQRMPRIGNFYFCWKPAGVVLQCVTDFKGTLGLTAVKVRTPEQADRWVRLVMAAYAQLQPARWPSACAAPGKTTRPVPAAHPRPGPPRVSQHPAPDRLYRFKTHRMAPDLGVRKISYAAW